MTVTSCIKHHIIIIIITIVIQRFNSALIMDFCFSDEDPDL